MGLFKKRYSLNDYKRDIDNIRDLITSINGKIKRVEFVDLFQKFLSNNIDKNYYEIVNDWSIDFATSNEILIKSPSGREYFHILVTPSQEDFNTLGIDYSQEDGNHIVNIVIHFNKDENKISYTRKEVERKIQGRNNDAQAMSNKTIIKNYIDGKLRYNYEYCVESCFRLDQNFSNASLSELFVNIDNNAVKRVARISENDWDGNDASITYYEADYYREKPFNDLFDHETIATKMVLSNKNKFEEFINSSNNILCLKK